MTVTELKHFEAMLETSYSELAPSLRKRDGIAIEKTSDALDEVQLANERELATRNLERETKLLRSLRAALNRIEAGTYGVCLQCEEAIGAKRLRALPWSPLCIRCQEKADRNVSGVESDRPLLADAA
jgi:DnaK suppressor protein